MFSSLSLELKITQLTAQFGLCTKDYIAEMHPAWGQSLEKTFWLILLSWNVDRGSGSLCNLRAFFQFIVMGALFLPPSDVYVRSFLYPFYTLIKLYYTKALSDQASSLAPNWILLSWRPSIPVSFRGSATTFQKDWCWSWASNTLAPWCEELTL